MSDMQQPVGEGRRALEYEEMKARAKRKCAELMILFEQMRMNRAIASSDIPTGSLMGSKEDLKEKYILAQATICSLASKLLMAVSEMLH